AAGRRGDARGAEEAPVERVWRARVQAEVEAREGLHARIGEGVHNTLAVEAVGHQPLDQVAPAAVLVGPADTRGEQRPAGEDEEETAAGRGHAAMFGLPGREKEDAGDPHHEDRGEARALPEVESEPEHRIASGPAGGRAARRVLDVLLELLPERLLRRLLAVVDERADRLAELVERDGPDRGFALDHLIAVDPERDFVLVLGIEREELLAGDLIHLLARRACRLGRYETAEHRAHCQRTHDPTLLHDALREAPPRLSRDVVWPSRYSESWARSCHFAPAMLVLEAPQSPLDCRWWRSMVPCAQRGQRARSMPVRRRRGVRQSVGCGAVGGGAAPARGRRAWAVLSDADSPPGSPYLPRGPAHLSGAKYGA